MRGESQELPAKYAKEREKMRIMGGMGENFGEEIGRSG